MTSIEEHAARLGCTTPIHRGAFDAAVPPLVGTRAWALVTTRGWEARGAAARLVAAMPHPPLSILHAEPLPRVDTLIEIAKQIESVEVFVALGGGSAIDSAKAFVAFGAGGAAIIAVPTTAGTGAEITPTATVWEASRKRSLDDPRLIPEAVVLDATLLESAPRDVAVASELDALSHALEAIWNRRHTPASDAAARDAIRLLRASRAQEGALLAGMAIRTTRTALAHSLSYPLTARFGLPHGIACSFSLAEVARFNLQDDAERLAIVADALETDPADVPAAIERWLAARGAGAILRRYVTRGDLALVDDWIEPARAGNNLRPCDTAQAAALAARAYDRLMEASMTDERRYARELGARILSEANDLKRTPEVLADETGFDVAIVRGVMAGESDADTARQLAMRMAATYPIALDEVWLERADTDAGVRVMHERESRASARHYTRTDGAGRDVVYFEYRDTVMSRVAPFKPEWVQPLRVVGDDSPDNDAVAFNNGHLLHQLTFYIGAVNVYWIIGGRRHCARMNTGDSSYMAPFIPHSFTSRDARLGLIIAVTYAGDVQPALPALGRLEPRVAAELAGDLRDAASTFRAAVRRYAAAACLTQRDVAEALEREDIDAHRANELAAGAVLPSATELSALATILGVRPADLAVTPLAPNGEVVIRHAADSPLRPYPDAAWPAYLLADLARTPHQPGLRGFDLHVPNNARGDGTLRHHLHEYVYNYGDAPLQIEWSDGRMAPLEPDASAYIEPMVAHRFRASRGDGRLAVIRVPGRLNDSVFREYALFGSERARALHESKQWFDGSRA